MHSRIFQVSLKPIKPVDYIRESNYYEHWFTMEVADYVNGDTNRIEDIEWLKGCYQGLVFGSDDNGEYFVVENKEEYFKAKFERFMETVEKIKDFNLKNFTDGFTYEMYKLKEAYEDKYGFYVDTDGEMLTLDSFIRYCATNAKYYIGATIDYHF